VSDQDARPTDKYDDNFDDGYPPPLPMPKTSGLAIAALALGVASFMTMGVTAIPGLICGIIALMKISNSRGRIGGQGLAVAGTVLSCIGLLVMLILVCMLMPALARARSEARKVRCAANLGSLGKGCHMWLNTMGKNAHFPPSFRTLFDDGLVQEPRCFICPASDTEYQPGEYVGDYESILDMIGRRTTETEMTSNMPLAWDKEKFHPDGRCVVYVDAHVDFVPEEHFQEMLKRVKEHVRQLKAGKNPEWE
jgi:uncharacterized protein DUF4190